MEREEGRGRGSEGRGRTEGKGSEGTGREPVRREGAPPMLAGRDPWLSPHLDVMRSMIRDFNRMFEGWPYVPAISSSGMGALGTSWPRIELFERDQSLVVRAELPGLEREDVRVRVQEDSLIIEGERRSDQESRREGYYESEWSYGRFSRRVPLPAAADPDQVRAQFRNGILEVTVGLPRPTMREIPIQTEAGETRDRELEAKGRETTPTHRGRDQVEVSGSRERGGTTS